MARGGRPGEAVAWWRGRRRVASGPGTVLGSLEAFGRGRWAGEAGWNRPPRRTPPAPTAPGPATFQLAEVAVPRRLYRAILDRRRRFAALSPRAAPI